MQECLYESIDQPIDEVIRHLSNVPITDELAPGIEPGDMPFLQNLHATQRELLESEYRSATLLESTNPAMQELSFMDEAFQYLNP